MNAENALLLFGLFLGVLVYGLIQLCNKPVGLRPGSNSMAEASSPASDSSVGSKVGVGGRHIPDLMVEVMLELMVVGSSV